MPSKGRGMARGFRLGNHNALCDRCQRKFFGSDLKKEWTGFLVCDSCWEPRHPQEFLRGHPDRQSVEDARPDTIDPTIEYVGDAGKSLRKHVNLDIQNWNTELTNDRVIILDASNAQKGDQFIIYKTEDNDDKLFITSKLLYSGTSV